MKPEEIEALEAERDDPKQILTLGWIRVINKVGREEITPETWLIALVAANDWYYRSGNQAIQNKVISPINEWFDKHKFDENIDIKIKKEVEMWQWIKAIREGKVEKGEILKQTDSTQKAILMARLARKNGDQALMKQAIDLETKLNSGVPNRQSTLLRWQKEMSGLSKIAAMARETVVKTEYWSVGLIANALIKTDFNQYLDK